MLGRSHLQRGLFEVQAWPHRAPAISFRAQLGAVVEQLFTDADLAEMYCPGNTRPSLPLSLPSGVLLPQPNNDVSDA